MDNPNCEKCDDLGIIVFPTYIPVEGEIEFDSEDCECQKNNEGT